ncbi:MAG: hypothetical protein P9M14_16235 [Candidatus Alcyoniella australis]|nr:hypothetical protein [Candidatus Alcyoniella australis]
MKRVDMIRCTLLDRDNDERAAYYLPKAVYDMWKYIVTQQGAYEIEQVLISSWVDEEGYSYERGLRGDHHVEPVVEVCLNVRRMAEEDEAKPTMRYIAASRFDKALEYLKSSGLDQITFDGSEVTRGYFLVVEELPLP